jgi:mono/diheme cytochrome c family protein
MNGRYVLVAAALVSTIACASKTNLSVSAKASSQTAAATGATAPTSLDLGNGISLDRVRIVVRKLKLEGTVAAADSASTTSSSAPLVQEADSDGTTELEREHDAEEEPVLGPFLVDLSGPTLAGGIQQAFDARVPQGTFHELKLAIGPVSVEKAGTDQKLAEMAAQNASIIVDGTIAGADGAVVSFSFVSSLRAEVDKEGKIVVSDAKGNNVTLSIDPKGWFGGNGTALLDPRDPANKEAIEANIRASLDAFEDDDKDGDEGAGAGDDHDDAGSPAPTPSPTPPAATIDGAALYTADCAGCHGALPGSKKGSSAATIQNAINMNYGGMGQFSNLTAAQVAAIATAIQ